MRGSFTFNESRWSGYPPTEAVQAYLRENPAVDELVLSMRDYGEFCAELRRELGTLYPYQDGGVRYPGLTHFVIVKGDYAT